MASFSNASDLLKRIQELEQENAQLKIKTEITMLEQQLDDFKIQTGCCTSTPITEGTGIPRHQNDSPRNPSARSGTFVRPTAYDGSSSWHDFKAHFETCAEINDWNQREKGQYLAVSLRGQAQGILGNLPSGCKDYDALVKALEERFAPPNQTELYRVQLRERRQKASETLSELGQDVRRLTNLAYPSAPADLKETLAKEQFIDSLVSMDMRLRIKQARPTDLNDAVRHAVELEAFCRAEKAKLEGQGVCSTTNPGSVKNDGITPDTLKSIQSTIERLERQMKALEERRTSHPNRLSNGWRSTKRCFICGSNKHLRARCPKLQENPSDMPQKVSKQGTQGSTADAKSVGSGLFIPATFDGQDIECLVDTGATLTILSTRVWEASDMSYNCKLTSYDRKLIAASGNPLVVKGKTLISLQIDGECYEAEVVVADVENDLMMGLDFMQTHSCTIDIVKNELTINRRKVKLNCRGSVGCYRVTVEKDVTIPARSEVVLDGFVPGISEACKGTFLVETSERLIQSGKGLLAKSLVKGDTRVPLRIMNVSDEDQVLHRGTFVGNMSPVTEVKAMPSAPNTKEIPEHLEDLHERTVEGMTAEQCTDVRKLLVKYASVFSESDGDLGRTGIVRHGIDTGNAHPIKQPLRRNPVHMNPEIDRQIDDMLDKNVIQPSSSPWSSGIVLVTKKDGSKRFCVDYRKLNEVTVKDSYPLPRIDDSLEQLAGAQWFSCLDLNSGYWQVELEEADRPKTAFNSRRGLFEFRVMPFGLCNAPATFERLMETVLAGLNWQICLIYLDDIIVHGHTFESMLSNLDKVLERLQGAGLKLKPRKCQLFRKEVVYLGHVVTAEGIKTDPQKTQAVQEWAEPMNVTEVRSFLGFCSYYRKFIKGFATKAKPLQKLTEKGVKFVWSVECQNAFDALKTSLCEAPILAHPDFTKEFILDTDASDFGIGAVLSQVLDGQERVIAFASKTLTKSERRYCVTRKELYALVHFVRYFRHYLYGKTFTVRTDHGSLRWLMNFKNPEGQIARWIEVLASYDMKIEHRPGRKHQNADGLSRKGCKQCLMKGTSQHQVAQVEAKSISEAVSLEEAQETDNDLCKVRKWVESGEKPDKKLTECESYFLKALLCQWERLEIHDGILVRVWKSLDSNLVLKQGIVPMKMRREVLKYSHDIKASGHLGIKKTLSRIRQGYYWPGMQNDVKAYINGCETCAKQKDPNQTKRAPMGIVQSGFPMERIAIDILGDFPQTERGNRYILVIGDYFTKWTECHAMPNMEARTIATILVDQVITRFGIPRRIHSDQGRQFESQLFAELCKLLQIEKTRTTPYHAMSDGMVERFNKTLVAMLSAFVNSNHTDWDEQLQLVMMAYRSAAHETTGFTPNMCMLGRETACPLDIMYEMPSSIKEIPVNQWIWELQERLEAAHKLVRQNTNDAMRRQKRYHDSKLSFETFTPGEKVYVFFPVKRVGCSSKLTSYWRGPYEVKEKLSGVLYKVTCGRAGSEQVIHCDRLRRCKQQVLTGESLFEQKETEADDEDLHSPEFEVNFPSRRERQKPIWMKDYVLSLSRKARMPPQGTERKAMFICSNCKTTLGSPEAFGRHMATCTLKALDCEECKKTFASKKSLSQHIRKKHSSTQAKETATQETVAEESDWNVDSECELLEGGEDEEELLLGRVLCKRTEPQPVLAPKRQRVSATAVSSGGQLSSQQAEPVLQIQESVDANNSVEQPRNPRVIKMKCCNVTNTDLKSRSVDVDDSEVGTLFSTRTASRKPMGTLELCLGDIVPEEGQVNLRDITVKLQDSGELELELKY